LNRFMVSVGLWRLMFDTKPERRVRRPRIDRASVGSSLGTKRLSHLVKC
jgi:hypothetical protein